MVEWVSVLAGWAGAVENFLGLGQGSGLPTVVSTGAWLLLGLLAVVFIAYAVRHYTAGLHRLLWPQRRTFEGLHTANWPQLIVLVAAHNEEAVVGDCLKALTECDYPLERLMVVPVNDRSKDRTREICDDWARRFPGLIRPFHRTGGRPGKPAALKDALAWAGKADAYVFFDADYLPSRGLLKQLVAPLLDPEVGITMGRVVPVNTGQNLLTRLLDLERSAGYQGDQQARQNLRTLPQFGGTVGAVRARALAAVGGFNEDALAEDTDLTFRMLSHGWRVHYANTAECYEEVPETWPVRARQLQRWANGHCQVALRYLGVSLTNPSFTVRQRLESLALLGCYFVAPLTLLGWLLVLLGFLSQPGWSTFLGASTLALVAYGGFGNAASFFQMAVAVRLDGNARRLRLLPLTFVGYVVSAVVITQGVLSLLRAALLRRELSWDKTARFRQQPPAPGAGRAKVATPELSPGK
jgi:cellulose synthase/poly-beta-1,6-N-acetylglucosamine synthase-like glycosyltransferase